MFGQKFKITISLYKCNFRKASQRIKWMNNKVKLLTMLRLPFHNKLTNQVKVCLKESVYKPPTGPGCRRKPANCTGVRGSNSFPPIGGFSITLRSVLFSTGCVMRSLIPGMFCRNDASDSLNFFSLNLLRVWWSPYSVMRSLSPVSSAFAGGSFIE